MTKTEHSPIKLFQFPRMFGIPNVSRSAARWRRGRIAGVPHEVVDTSDPRAAPKGKLPFIEDAGTRVADTSLVIKHLVTSRGVDPAHLDARQHAIALLVQRALEEHYAFVLAYTHLYRDEGWRYLRVRFDVVPALVRPLVRRRVHGRIEEMLWKQGILRRSHDEVVESASRRVAHPEPR